MNAPRGSTLYLVTGVWAHFGDGLEGDEVLGVFSSQDRARHDASAWVRKIAGELDAPGRLAWVDTSRCVWRTEADAMVFARIQRRTVR